MLNIDMKIIFLTRYYWPHIGGVERHVEQLSSVLTKSGHQVTVVTTQFDQFERSLRRKENINGVKIIRFDQPHIKFIGLIVTWIWILKNRNIFEKADIIHAHDVGVWYLPLLPFIRRNKFFLTSHGWEGIYPIPFHKILLRKIAYIIAYKKIAIGSFIDTFYKVRSDIVLWGGIDTFRTGTTQKEDMTVFVGRLEKDTGLPEFLKELKNKRYIGRIIFVGDGSLRSECERYGKVTGFTNPRPFLKKTKVCIPAGYLACLEAMSHKCIIRVYWSNQLKKAYWIRTPFYRFIKSQDIAGAYAWVRSQTWNIVGRNYLELWKS